MTRREEFTQVQVRRTTRATLGQLAKEISSDLGLSRLSLTDTIDQLAKYYYKEHKKPAKKVNTSRIDNAE